MYHMEVYEHIFYTEEEEVSKIVDGLRKYNSGYWYTTLYKKGFKF